MRTFDDERDDAALDEEEPRSAPGQWNRPLLLAGLGLVLMLIGYAATTYVPASPRQAEQERRLAELRRLAAERRANDVEDSLPERLEGVALPARYPPYEMPGRLAIYGGLILFIMAGVIMYRNSPPPRRDIDDRE